MRRSVWGGVFAAVPCLSHATGHHCQFVKVSSAFKQFGHKKVFCEMKDNFADDAIIQSSLLQQTQHRRSLGVLLALEECGRIQSWVRFPLKASRMSVTPTVSGLDISELI